jgi:molybdenum cofactor synthesis domain-containing protein
VTEPPPTAAIVIIGDEILTGKFDDQNGPFLIRRLRELGLTVRRISVVADEIDDIASEVRRCSDRFDVVFTSGGVGPTHDDVTLMAIAQAFAVSLHIDDELMSLMNEYGLPSDEATRRMAAIPEGGELLCSGSMAFPALRCRNVYVLPGIPKLFRAKFEAIADHFAGPPIYTARLITIEFETAIAERLTGVNDRHPDVSIGSYPRPEERRVIVTLESTDQSALNAAVQEMKTALGVTGE